MDKPAVIIDTREKHPLKFNPDYIGETISKKLDTGDYSIEGLEDVLFIERKSSLSEFYGNITQKRFWNELDRTKDFKYKFLVLEFDLEDINMFPHNSGIPKSKWKSLRVTYKYLIKCISRIQLDYGIHVIFATNTENAQVMTERIIRDVYGKT